jgi:antitoxin FitA
MHMPSLQIRDMPEDVYEALAERAREQRRSLAQQAVAELARVPEIEARQKRQQLVKRLRATPPRLPKGAPDPVDLVREDRER